MKKQASDGMMLKLTRIQKGLLQYQVAASCGISPQRLSLIENGRIPVGPMQLERILSAIECLSG